MDNIDNNSNSNTTTTTSRQPPEEDSACQGENARWPDVDVPQVHVTFHLSSEEESSRLTLQEVRERLKDYVQSVTRVDASLVTLTNQMMTMRDQDLQLLKQLIQVGDTIRRMTRYHSFENPGHRRKRGTKTSRGSTQELMTSAVDLSVTLRRSSKSGSRVRSGSIFASCAGDYSTVPLLRRQSEPHMCSLSPGGMDLSGDDLYRGWGMSRLGSGSSTEWLSEDTLGSSDDGLDTIDSDEDSIDQAKKNNSPGQASNMNTTDIVAINTTDTTTSTIIHEGVATTIISTTAASTKDTNTDTPTPNSPSSFTENATLEDSPSPLDTTSDSFVQRPKSHSVVAASYMGRPKMSGAVSSAYSDILSKNVRLWKDRLEHAYNVRQRVAILEEESHES